MMNTAKKIKILMVEKNISGAGIARMADVDRTAVYHVMSGRSKSHNLRQLIAREVGVPIEDLWPGESRRIMKNRPVNKARSLSNTI